MKATKRLLALLLCIALVMGLCTTGFAAVSEEEYASVSEKIQWLIDNGYVEGDANGLRVEDSITRAEFATILARALASEEEFAAYANLANGFTDVNATDWFAGAVNYCFAKNAVAGFGDGTFQPNANVTGVQAAKMILCGILGNDEAAYTNTAKWALNVYADAEAVGLFEDVEGDYGEDATRGDCFTMLYNALFVAKAAEVSLNDWGLYTVKADVLPVELDGTGASDDPYVYQVGDGLYTVDSFEAKNPGAVIELYEYVMPTTTTTKGVLNQVDSVNLGDDADEEQYFFVKVTDADGVVTWYQFMAAGEYAFTNLIGVVVANEYAALEGVKAVELKEGYTLVKLYDEDYDEILDEDDAPVFVYLATGTDLNDLGHAFDIKTLAYTAKKVFVGNAVREEAYAVESIEYAASNAAYEFTASTGKLPTGVKATKAPVYVNFDLAEDGYKAAAADGNYIKYIDFDGDKTVDFVIVVEFTMASKSPVEGAAPAGAEGAEGAAPAADPAAAPAGGDEDEAEAREDEFALGIENATVISGGKGTGVVVYAQIEDLYYITDAASEFVTVKSTNTTRTTVTTAAGVTFTESDISAGAVTKDPMTKAEMTALENDGYGIAVVGLNDGESYNFYFDNYGYLRAYGKAEEQFVLVSYVDATPGNVSKGWTFSAELTNATIETADYGVFFPTNDDKKAVYDAENAFNYVKAGFELLVVADLGPASTQRISWTTLASYVAQDDGYVLMNPVDQYLNDDLNAFGYIPAVTTTIQAAPTVLKADEGTFYDISATTGYAGPAASAEITTSLKLASDATIYLVYGDKTADEVYKVEVFTGKNTYKNIPTLASAQVNAIYGLYAAAAKPGELNEIKTLVIEINETSTYEWMIATGLNVGYVAGKTAGVADISAKAPITAADLKTLSLDDTLTTVKAATTAEEANAALLGQCETVGETDVYTYSKGLAFAAVDGELQPSLAEAYKTFAYQWKLADGVPTGLYTSYISIDTDYVITDVDGAAVDSALVGKDLAYEGYKVYAFQQDEKFDWSLKTIDSAAKAKPGEAGYNAQDLIMVVYTDSTCSTVDFMIDLTATTAYAEQPVNVNTVGDYSKLVQFVVDPDNKNAADWGCNIVLWTEDDGDHSVQAPGKPGVTFTAKSPMTVNVNAKVFGFDYENKTVTLANLVFDDNGDPIGTVNGATIISGIKVYSGETEVLTLSGDELLSVFCGYSITTLGGTPTGYFVVAGDKLTEDITIEVIVAGTDDITTGTPTEIGTVVAVPANSAN